jgi:hypothetical protein
VWGAFISPIGSLAFFKPSALGCVWVNPRAICLCKEYGYLRVWYTYARVRVRLFKKDLRSGFGLVGYLYDEHGTQRRAQN